jgi:hypothetical protein
MALSIKDEEVLETFTKYRYNTQRDDKLSVDRGPHQQIPIELYKPGSVIINTNNNIITDKIFAGLFNVSGFRPMLQKTRELLGTNIIITTK